MFLNKTKKNKKKNNGKWTIKDEVGALGKLPRIFIQGYD